MQKNKLDTKLDFHTEPFFDDISLLLDIYDEGDSVEVFKEKIAKSKSPPVDKGYPLVWVAEEIMLPNIINVGAAGMLKRIAQSLPSRNLRQIIGFLAILQNENLKSFMALVLFDVRNKGMDAIYAEQIYNFARHRVSITEGFAVNSNGRNVDIVNSNGLSPKAVDLTKLIIRALISYDMLKPSRVNQNSSNLSFSFGDLDIHDSTIIFFMYWLRSNGRLIRENLNNEIWHSFGLNNVSLLSRMKEVPLNRFFKSDEKTGNQTVYGYSNTTEVINRLKVILS